MLLIIHNLPSDVKYSEIKSLIQTKCGLSDFVLDNLTSEGMTKRVTVGLADEGDAAFLVRKINGLYLNGMQLYVEDVRQSRASDQPYRPKAPEFDYQQASNYQRDGPRIMEPKGGYQNNPVLGYQDNSAMGYEDQTMLMNQNAMMMGNVPSMAMGAVYYQPVIGMQPQTSYMGIADQSQQMTAMNQMSNPQQDRGYGYGGQIEDDRARGWDDNRADMRRQRSPPRRGPNAYDAPARWEAPEPVPAPAAMRRRSPSPPRNWNNSVAAFANYYDNPQQTQAQNYDQPENFGTSYAVPAPAEPNVFGDHVVGRQDRGFSGRQQWNEPDSFQPQGRANGPNQRGGNFGPPSKGPSSFGTANRSSGNFGPSNKGPGNFGPSNKGPGNFGSSSKGPGNFGSSNKGPGNFGPSNKGPGNFGSPNKGPGNFGASNKGPKPFGGRNRDDNQKPGNKWRDEPKVAQKRFADRKQADEPPHKKFAQTRPQRPEGGNKPNTSRFDKPQRQETRFDGGPPKGELKLTMKKMLVKDETWRGQAAADLAREMAKTMRIDLPALVMTKLKRSIRSRINLLLGSKLSNGPEDIVKRYRGRFPKGGDSEFVEAVIETVKEEESNKPSVDPNTSGSKESPTKPVRPAEKKEPKPKKNQPPPPKKEGFTVQYQKSGGKLPKYPNADKKSVHRLKVEERHNKEEIQKELSPALQKALAEEVDVLCDLFMSECMDAKNEKERGVCEQIADVVSDDFRKVIRLHMSKRLLNMNTNLTVRAIPTGKMINRDLLETFVRDYGAVALKKSEKAKMYLVFIDTFDNYDRLVALAEVSIGGFTVRFKPLHVLGAPPTAKETREQMLKKKNRFIKTQIDKSGENLLEPGYTITPTVDSVAATDDETTKKDNKTGKTDGKDTKEEIKEKSNQNGKMGEENPLTGEVNVEGEHEVYIIEDDEEGEEMRGCRVEDVIDCDAEDSDGAGGGNVDEDDLEDY